MGSRQCAACDKGQYQDDPGAYECKACRAGEYQDAPGAASGCKTCAAQSARTANNHCGDSALGAGDACHPGYYLSGTTCQAYTCSSTSGQGSGASSGGAAAFRFGIPSVPGECAAEAEERLFPRCS